MKLLYVTCRSQTALPQPQDDAKTHSKGNAKKAYRLYAQDGMIPNYTGYVPRTFVLDCLSVYVCKKTFNETSYGSNCWGNAHWVELKPAAVMETRPKC